MLSGPLGGRIAGDLNEKTKEESVGFLAQNI